MGVQGDSTSEARIAGFKQGIAEAGGEYLSAETQYADSVADKAVTCMEPSFRHIRRAYPSS